MGQAVPQGQTGRQNEKLAGAPRLRSFAERTRVTARLTPEVFDLADPRGLADPADPSLLSKLTTPVYMDIDFGEHRR